MMNCRLACPCDATVSTCENGCYSLADTLCMEAIMPLRTCAPAAGCTEPSCTLNTTGIATDTSTSASTATLTNLSTATATGGCAAAAQCCATLAALGGAAAQLQQECATLAAQGDAACSQFLGIIRGYGFCK
jgi:hypothetical protein